MRKAHKPRYRWIAGAVLFGLAASFLAVGMVLSEFREETNALWDEVLIGDTEERVRATLGPPFREYSAETAPADYYLGGYRHQPRMISGSVLIYVDADLVLYVWIDLDGRVEATFRGTS